MKYCLPSARTQVRKPFNMATALEELNESLEAVDQSYKAMCAAEGRVLEIEEVIADSHAAMESISKYGVSSANMAILNKDNSLDKALGLENLVIESLESLSASTKIALQQRYVAGLEELNANASKSVWQHIKDFFAKIIQWLKDFFTNTAKMVNIVKQLKFENLDENATATVHKADDADKMVAACLSAVELVESFAKNPVYDENGNTDDLTSGEVATKAESLNISKYPKENGKLKSLGWDAQRAARCQSNWVKLVAETGSRMDKAWKDLQADYRKVTAGSGEDPAKAAKIASKAFNKWKQAARLTGQYNACVKAVGTTLLTLSKSIKAEPPAAQ